MNPVSVEAEFCKQQSRITMGYDLVRHAHSHDLDGILQALRFKQFHYRRTESSRQVRFLDEQQYSGYDVEIAGLIAEALGR